MNVEDINRSISLITHEVVNPVVEIRLFKTKKGTMSGYYNKEGFNNIAKDLAGREGIDNVFITLHPVDERLLVRGINKMRDYVKETTTDKDIMSREWLFLDFDAKRPSGISSTEAEKKAAEDLRDVVLKDLSQNGFPEPVSADSGNGYHLLYKVSMLNDDETKKLMTNFLKFLSKKFSTDIVDIDKSVFNASRVIKLYGSLACKGESTEERPHRMSSIISIPNKIETLNMETIQKYIVEEKNEPIKPPAKETQKVKANIINDKSKFDIENFISKHNISISHTKDESDKTSYVLEECIFNSEHKSPDAAIFQYKDNGGLGFKCQHNTCLDKHWKDVRLHFEPDAYIKKEQHPKAVSKEKKKPQLGSDLWNKTLAPIEYLLDHTLSIPGVYLLAGASKMGKSWLGIDMSIAISNGVEFFGKKTTKAKTLYIDLESSETSLKSRLKAMYKNGIDLSNWSYLHSFERIGEGFEEDLVEMIHENKFKLIIIDVFVKVRSAPNKGATEYQHDYHDIGILKKIALEFGVCFLVVTHLRKMKDEDDVFNTMTGSTGLMGASDGALLLARKRGEDNATLHMDGRDIKSDSLALMWNKEKTRWQYLGKSEDVKENILSMQFVDSSLFEIIRRVLDDNGEIIMTPTELFTKITFEYPDVIDLPKSNTVFAKALMSNIINFQKNGIGIVRERSGKSRSIKIYNCPVTAVIDVTPVTPVIAVIDEDNNIFSDSNI